jgi:hypothetical protein
MTETIWLTSQRDGVSVSVAKTGALLSKLVAVALSADEPFELSLDVPGEVLQQVASYMDHHQRGEPAAVKFPLRSRRMQDLCEDGWDASFIDEVNAQALAEAAHYLDMDTLTHLCCAKIATRFWNRSPQQIAALCRM